MHEDVARLIVSGTCPALRELAPELPEGLPEVVQRMMACDMEARPRSALEACELLAPFLQSEFRAELDAAELVVRAQGDRPRLAISDQRLRGVDTDTRARERPPSGAPGRGPTGTALFSAARAGDAPSPTTEARGGGRIGTAPFPAAHAVDARGSAREQNNEDGFPITAVLPTPATALSNDRARGRRWLPPRWVVGWSIVASLIGFFVLGGGRRPPEIPQPQRDPSAANPAPAAPAIAAGSGAPSPSEPAPQGPSTLRAPAEQASLPDTAEIEARRSARVRDREQDMAQPGSDVDLRGEKNTRPAQRRPPTLASTRGDEEQERNAWINVQLISKDGPWHVWVDGQYGGTAPVNVKVAQGRHLVEVGLDKPSIQRIVRVPARTTRDVTFSP
jgi:hypothetical protein